MTTRCIRCGNLIQGVGQFCEDCAAQQAEATGFPQAAPPAQTWGAQPAAQPAPASPATCPSCGAAVPSGATFCGVCGGQVPGGTPSTCSNCGTALAPGVQFCANCGAQVMGQEYAGFWSRFLALIIDGFVVLLLAGLPAGVIAILAESVPLFYAIYIAIGILYYTWGNGNGGTWGKQAMGLRVISRDTGAQIGLGAGFGRWFVWWLGSIPFYLGWLWMLWDREKRCWHDHAAGSIVVRVRP